METCFLSDKRFVRVLDEDKMVSVDGFWLTRTNETHPVDDQDFIQTVQDRVLPFASQAISSRVVLRAQSFDPTLGGHVQVSPRCTM